MTEKLCKHTIGGDYKASFVDDMTGLYAPYTCPKCDDSIKDYYDLANRFNETRDIEEQIPEFE